MTEVGPADRSRLLRSKRDEFTSIVTSRKRKLRQLFAVATESDAFPTNDFANPDAPPTSAAELQFLQTCDISQGRKLNEANVPARPQLRYDALRHSLERSGLFAPEPTPAPATKQDAATESQTNEALPSQRQPVAETSDGKGIPPSPRITTGAPLPSSLPPKPPTPVSVAAAPATSTPSGVARPSVVPAPVPSPSPAAVPPKDPLHASRQEASEAADAADAEAAEKSAPSPARNESSGVYKQPESRSADASHVAPAQPAPRPPAPQLPPRPDVKQPEEAKSPAVKLPPDVSRAAEGFSSPSSTTQTAATPAVHDVSTDTSPDNEGPQYLEPAGVQNETDAADGAEQAKESDTGHSSDADSNHARIPDGPEAQLLQESMAMDSKPTPTAAQTAAKQPTPPAVPVVPVVPVATSKEASEQATPSIPPIAKEASEQATPSIPPNAQDAPLTKVEPIMSVKEIPDSQESQDADRMDVDQPATTQAEEKPSVQVQDTRAESKTAETQQTPSQAPVETPQDPERAVTRTASGTIRQKSVAEILGGSTPMDSAQTGVAVKVPPSQLTPMTATPKSPTRPKVFANKKKEKEKAKNKPSAVVFGKQTKRSVDKSLMPSQQKQSFLPTDDYFTPLFVQGFTQTSKWMKPIEVVLNQSHKTVSTPDAYVAIQDNQACRVLRRVYHLQQHDKWSLRQPKRCPEPVRPESHWDVLLHEMKWMRTDFREEKKWRLAAARNLAHACAEWVASTEDERKELQVSSYIPPLPQPADTEADISMAETAMDVVDAQATPELVPSGDQDSPEHVDELQEEAIETVAPSAIFALEEDDVVFELRSSPATDQLLQELPMYGTPLKVPAFDFTGPEFDPDAHWRRPALPLSKYVEGEMKLSSDGPPRKRSRYQYEEEEDDDDERVVFGSQPAKKMKLPPQNTDVALFNPEMKPIRDRLHAGHQFRPPAEYQMPMQNFYECRSPSQWTLSEDDELRSLVREYSYNWSLISSLLTPRSLFNSGAERRTPWECFERWINLEGLPTDMQKTQYFKAYQNRIDAANRVIMQQNQIAQQQAAGSTTPATPVARRRPSTPLRVERRRNQKHLTLIDAMRKLAKKRETAAQKQQHATQMAAMRKANEAAQPRGPTKTPRDYSLMRWERDQQLAEKVAQFHRRQEDQRRIAMQARQGQVAAQIATTPGAGQAQTNAAAQVNGTIPRPNMPNQLAVPGQAGRGRIPVQAPTANMGGVPAQMGGLVPPAMQMNGVPQAQMQAAMQAQHRMPMPNPQPDVNLMLQARRISEQQRQAVQLQQAQQQAQQQVHPQQPQQQHQPQQQQGQQMHQGTPTSHASQSHSPPNMRPASVNGVNGANGVNGVNQQNIYANAQALMASVNSANGVGVSTPPAGGLHMPNGTAGSPRPLTQVPASIQVQLNNLENQYRAKNPNLTPEQVRQAATEYLTRLMIAQRTNMSQNAMNAAAGGGGAASPGIANGLAATTSPHQYAALLRQQQQQQAAAAAAQNGQPQNGQHQQTHHQQHHGQQAQLHHQQQQHGQQHHAQQQQNGQQPHAQQQHVQPQHTQHQQHQVRAQPTPQPQPQTQTQQLPKQAQHQQQHQPQQVQRTPSGQPTQPAQQHPQQAQQAQKPPTPHTPVQQVQKPPTPVAPVAPVQKPPTPQMQKAQTPQMQKAQTPQMQKAQTPQMQQQAQAQPQAQQQAQQAAHQAQQQRQASGSATPSATPAT
ncbi:MYB and HSA domain-containing protein [Colletotrichum tabaci]|uniref:Vacuolar import and degradation protein 21 n=1 Tax=Colletotrichum tabaci TaxID=1209068 RepID=A0AAV9SU37_9PEZI